jgi:hypothetical protein
MKTWLTDSRERCRGANFEASDKGTIDELLQASRTDVAKALVKEVAI